MRLTQTPELRRVGTPDLLLFVAHTAWLVEALDLRIDELLELLSGRLAEPLDLLRLELLLNRAESVAAEEAMCRVLGQNLRRTKRALRWTSEPGREVDWSRTALEAPLRGLGQYATRTCETRPDAPLLGSLRSLAERRRAVLALTPRIVDQQARIGRLSSALAGVMAPAQPWTEAMARRLRTVDGDAARAIQLGEDLLTGLRGKALREELECTVGRDFDRQWRLGNPDTLLEWTFALSVARAAAAAGWLPLPWRGLEKNHGYPDLTFTQGQRRCRISKGRPRDGNGNGSQADDELSVLIRATGNSAYGGQPDVVLTFWHVGKEKDFVTYLADAKRNIDGDGKNYLSSSIAKGLVYATAYAQYLRAKPYCTLLFYQAVSQVLGVTKGDANGTWRDELAVAMKNPDTVLPKVLALDLGHVGLSANNSLEWPEQPLRAWFERLASDALAAMQPASGPGSGLP